MQGAHGDWDEAIEDLTAAIRLNPKDSRPYYHRGLAFAQKREWQKAKDDYDCVIHLSPNDSKAYCARGSANCGLGQYDHGVNDYNKAIQLNPGYTDALYRRGQVFRRNKEWKKATSDFRSALRNEPKLALLNNALAWLLATCPDASVRDGEQAVELAQQACELSDWKKPNYIDTLAAACAEAGGFEDAVRWEKQYLDSGPSDAAAQKARQRLNLYEQKQA